MKQKFNAKVFLDVLVQQRIDQQLNKLNQVE